MTTKKFYWLKLKNTFFNQKEIKLLRRIAGGDTYTVIYLKLMLLSLENEGTVFFDNVTDKFEEELALELDEDVENIQVTISFLKAKGLLEIKDDDEYFLNEVPTMIGKESESAARVRRHRNKKRDAIFMGKDNIPLQSNVSALQGNSNVIPCNTEIDIDLELDLDLEKDIAKKKKNNSSKQALISERFEKIWKLYPKKQGKTDAMNHYKKAINEGITDEVILTGLQSYLQHIERNRIEPKYIKQGSTWFSKRSWNDEYNFTKIKQDNGIYQQTFSKENDPVITEEEARQAEEDLKDMV